jgi:hypothetical protein
MADSSARKKVSYLRKSALTLATVPTLALGGAVGLSATSAANAELCGNLLNHCVSHWDQWGQPCGTYLCLYYSPGLWNGSWRPSWYADSDLAGNKFYDSGYFGSGGVGQVVRNNAASVGNKTTNCMVGVFKYTSYRGVYDYVHPLYSGDLNGDAFGGVGFDGLRNDNASIKAYNCSG